MSQDIRKALEAIQKAVRGDELNENDRLALAWLVGVLNGIQIKGVQP
jgi:hypothetical protein